MRMVILGGQMESGQGWIALEFTTRVDGNAESAPAPAKTSTGMNLDEIKAGNFSSVAEFGKISTVRALSLMRKEL